MSGANPIDFEPLLCTPWHSALVSPLYSITAAQVTDLGSRVRF